MTRLRTITWPAAGSGTLDLDQAEVVGGGPARGARSQVDLTSDGHVVSLSGAAVAASVILRSVSRSEASSEAGTPVASAMARGMPVACSRRPSPAGGEADHDGALVARVAGPVHQTGRLQPLEQRGQRAGVELQGLAERLDRGRRRAPRAPASPGTAGRSGRAARAAGGRARSARGWPRTARSRPASAGPGHRGPGGRRGSWLSAKHECGRRCCRGWRSSTGRPGAPASTSCRRGLGGHARQRDLQRDGQAEARRRRGPMPTLRGDLGAVDVGLGPPARPAAARSGSRPRSRRRTAAPGWWRRRRRPARTGVATAVSSSPSELRTLPSRPSPVAVATAV